MALALYRRHRRDCKAAHKEELRTSEYDERKKGWARCECPIFVSGTLARTFRRQSTGQWEWEPAKAIARQFEAAAHWSIPIQEPPQQATASAVSDPETVAIERAVKAFQDEFQEHAAFATQKKYRLMFDKLKTFSAHRGYVTITQWGPSDVRDFRSSWAIGAQTASRRMSMLRAFFEYCVANEWIDRNPARMVKNPKTRGADGRNEQKLPFTDEELKRMYDACQTYGHTYRHKWHGDDLADFISLSVYTGLRISDVALFHIDRIKQGTGEILIRTTKSGTHVYTWVPEWLQERIEARAKTIGPFIFGAHGPTTLDIITNLWRLRLNKLWQSCGPWKVKPTPHRFRHTFARIILQRGVSVRDVADLLGNSEAICRRHYSAWIPERQERLTRILKEAFDDKPKPKLTVITGGRG